MRPCTKQHRGRTSAKAFKAHNGFQSKILLLSKWDGCKPESCKALLDSYLNCNLLLVNYVSRLSYPTKTVSSISHFSRLARLDSRGFLYLPPRRALVVSKTWCFWDKLSRDTQKAFSLLISSLFIVFVYRLRTPRVQGAVSAHDFLHDNTNKQGYSRHPCDMPTAAAIFFFNSILSVQNVWRWDVERKKVDCRKMCNNGNVILLELEA